MRKTLLHICLIRNISLDSRGCFLEKYSLNDGIFNALGGLLSSGVVNTDGPAGLSKSLVDNYLYTDGTFIDPAELKFKDFNQMFKDRDARLLLQ